VIGYLFIKSGPTAEAAGLYNWFDFLSTQLFFQGLLAGTVVFGVVMQLRQTRAGMGRCLTMGLSRLFHIMGITIIVGVITYIWFVPAVFVMVGGVVARDTGMIGLAILLVLAALVPFCIFLTRYYVAIPSVVLENVGVIGAMRRSVELTQGSRMTVFGAQFLVWILVIIMWIPIGYVVRMVLEGAAPTTVYLVNTGLGIVLAPLSAVIRSVIYHDLRVGKEGVAVEDLVAVFE
jgi:hypothetical protein